MKRIRIKVKHLKKIYRAARHISGKTWAGIGIALTFIVLAWSVIRWRAQNAEIVMAP